MNDLHVKLDAILANQAEILARLPKRKARAERHASVITWTPETGWQNVTPDDRREWSAAYPACNIDRQLAAMTAWLRANPTKAKKANWRRFVCNWMSRQQDRGGDGVTEPVKEPEGFVHRNPTDAEMAGLAEYMAEPQPTFDEMMRGK